MRPYRMACVVQALAPTTTAPSAERITSMCLEIAGDR